MKSAVPYVDTFLAHKVVPEGDLIDPPTHPETVVTSNRAIGEAAMKAVRPEIKKVLNGYDKVFGEEINNERTPWQAGIFEVPYFLYRYQVGGKNYEFAIDAMTGQDQFGTKPEFSKVLKWVIFLAIFFGSLYVWNVHLKHFFF
nr:hypothetical protein [Brucella intermedia]